MGALNPSADNYSAGGRRSIRAPPRQPAREPKPRRLPRATPISARASTRAIQTVAAAVPRHRTPSHQVCLKQRVARPAARISVRRARLPQKRKKTIPNPRPPITVGKVLVTKGAEPLTSLEVWRPIKARIFQDFSVNSFRIRKKKRRIRTALWILPIAVQLQNLIRSSGAT